MPLGTHYGSIVGLKAIGGPEVVRALIVPNLGEYDRLILKEAMEDDAKRKEAEMVVRAAVEALETLEEKGLGMTNGYTNGDTALGQKLQDKVGELIGRRILELGRPRLVKAILEA